MKIHFFILLLWLIGLGVVYAEKPYLPVRLKDCEDITDTEDCWKVSLSLNLFFLTIKKRFYHFYLYHLF